MTRQATPLIQPIGCYLPKPELASKIVAPDYDGMTDDERHQITQENPLSFLNLVRSEVDHPEHSRPARHELLRESSERLHALLGEVFVHYPGPLYLVCRIEHNGHSQTGLVADLSLDHYEAGTVRPHEETRQGQEDRLLEYMEAVRAHFLPVFVAHRRIESLAALLEEVTATDPFIDFHSEDGLRQALWLITNPDHIDLVSAAAGEIDAVYVADGHHRFAAAARFAAQHRAENPRHTGDEPYNSIVSVLFGDRQLQVYEYNRVITDLGGKSPPEFVARITASGFDVERMPEWGVTGARPAQRGDISMFLDGDWYRLRVTDIPADPLAALDVSLLHDRVLAGVLGIVDARNDPRVDFVPGTLGLEELERLTKDGFRAGFALFPTAVADLMIISDSGRMMPPKSTWFSPKLRSGLIVRLLD